MAFCQIWRFFQDFTLTFLANEEGRAELLFREFRNNFRWRLVEGFVLIASKINGLTPYPFSTSPLKPILFLEEGIEAFRIDWGMGGEIFDNLFGEEGEKFFARDPASSAEEESEFDGDAMKVSVGFEARFDNEGFIVNTNESGGDGEDAPEGDFFIKV